MLRFKRLYLYILQSFVPVFFMTFVICLFIILMQFVWKYVEDMVGKGLETTVLAELFTYAALALVPMALPLAILLASLMSFGNMGESYELLSIKAAGVSLLKTMRPLIILITLISIGAFFFQNDIIPKVNVKFKALLISIKQKSPELDIPEGTFYSGIDKYNIYVKSKNKETGMLRDVMIYDVSKGFDNMAVITCDSAKMQMSAAKDYLLLSLFQGQQFSNFRQSVLSSNSSFDNKFVPYSRENFKEKKVIILFDANFSRMDEAQLDGTQIAKNITELRITIDSLEHVVDSLNLKDREMILNYTYLAYKKNASITGGDSAQVGRNPIVAYSTNMDSLINVMSTQKRLALYSSAISSAENRTNEYMFRAFDVSKLNTRKEIRIHDVELQRKFVLSFACLVFFFIGAPLGAIIRKGGLGMPVVVSVALFIVYYIIDNLGWKMARDGVWPVTLGVWLSSFVLFPLGVFLTYKAMNDSSLFNPEAYGKFFRKILFIKPIIAAKEKVVLTVENLPQITSLTIDPKHLEALQEMKSSVLEDIIRNYNEYGYDKNTQYAALNILKSRNFDINDIQTNQNSQTLDTIYQAFCQSSIIAVVSYFILIASIVLGIFTSISIDLETLIIYLLLFIRSIIYFSMFNESLGTSKTKKRIFLYVLAFICYPMAYIYIKRIFSKELDKTRIHQFI